MSNTVTEPDGIRRGYLPGSWYAAVGPVVTVVVPADARGRVATVWERVDDGAGFEEVLDELLATGLRELGDLVLVGEDGGATRILVRGRGRVSCDTADGAVEVLGEDGTTWTERSLAGVTGITVEVETGAAGDELAVAGGLVRVSRVTWGGGAVVGGAVASTLAVPDEPEAVAAPGPAPEPVAHPVPERAPEPDAESPDDETGEHPEVAVAPPVPAGPGEPAAPSTAGLAETVPGMPVVEGADHDGHTSTGAEHRLPADPPGIPGQPPAPSVTARPVARLVLSSGDTIDVDRAILLGRAPEARRFASTDQPRLVTVPSPNHEISSTHLEIRPGSGVDHGMSVATDLGSTNGTMLMQPGLPPEELQPGIAVSLIPGAIIDLGDGVTIQVTNP